MWMRRLAVGVLLMIAMALSAQPAPPPAPPAQPSIELPAELDRVLRDYEKAWRGRDAAGLAELFTEDGFVLSNGSPAVRGRAAIREVYAQAGGPLFLRAFAYSTDGATGYIIGGFRGEESGADGGKFVLAIRKQDGKWLIAADMDNTNRHPRPPAPPTPPAPPAPPAPPTLPAPPPPPPPPAPPAV
jgi:ketosteroid isomerase-like protein